MVATGRAQKDNSYEWHGGNARRAQSSCGYESHRTYAVTGRRADAKRLVEMLVASDGSRYVPPFHIALAYAGLGDKDAAFRWLERAYNEHASFMDGVKVTPGLNVLHSDPRFAALLKRMNL